MCVYCYLEQGSTLVCDLSSRVPTVIRPRVGLYLKSYVCLGFSPLYSISTTVVLVSLQNAHLITHLPMYPGLRLAYGEDNLRHVKTRCQVSLPNRLQSQLLLFGPVSFVDAMANLTCTPDQMYMDLCD